MHVSDDSKKGVVLFKKYLQYVKFVSDGDIDSVQQLLNSMLDTETFISPPLTFDSFFEEQVYAKLTANGLNVHTQIGVSGYKIDLGIYNEVENKYVLGIECDGAIYHSSKSARERDIYRQNYLEGRGWNIIRIWSPDWWSNPDNEIDKIMKKLKDLK